MDYEIVVRNRRSVRSFQEKDVPDELLIKLVEHASLAPSPGNLQPWEFIIVKNRDLIEKIVSTTYSGNVKTSPPQTWIKSASAVIIVCYLSRPVSARYGEEGRVPGLLGIGAAIENLLLSAVNFGLGACWVSGFKSEELSKILNLPKGSEPISIIPVGYPKEIPDSPPKLPVDDIITLIK
ncbi:MAG: nitroreductase family protein [Nitrososphaeria archaeon]|nr:nitroreductase family protein [Nitrososphaeria archaeon]